MYQQTMECIEQTSLRMHHLINTSLHTDYVTPPRMRHYCLTTTVTNLSNQYYSYSPRCLPLFLDFSSAFNNIDDRLLQPGQKPLDSNVINSVLCALLLSIYYTNSIVQSLNAVTSPYSNRQTVPVKQYVHQTIMICRHISTGLAECKYYVNNYIQNPRNAFYVHKEINLTEQLSNQMVQKSNSVIM